VLTWSTDSLPAHERFAYWREERGKQLFGVTIELPPERRHLFHGRFSARPVGGATLASLNASAYEVSRTERDIARVSNDSLVIGLQVAGPGWCDTPAGQTFVDTGAVTVGHTDLPSQGMPTTAGDFHAHILKIPMARIAHGQEAARRLFLSPLQQERHARLVDAAVSALIEEAPSLAPDLADTAIRDIGHLALLARGALGSGLPEVRQALRSAHRHAAVRIMRRNLHRGSLPPETVADALGISLRQLHLVFEPTGRSYHRTLTALRVEMACRRLGTRPDQSVAAIAFACGFESLATFYRAIRQVTGRTPGDFRHGPAEH
jgi:AraC-like DNA-binding protein